MNAIGIPPEVFDYRPGNCAPYMCNPIPLSPRGAVFQAGAVVGTAAVLP